MTKRIHTIKGSIEIDSLGLILPHEHLFTDLRGPHVADYARGAPSAVVNVLEPYLAEAAEAGITALVECSTVGVGRNLPVLRSLAEATSIHIIAPTGVYRDAYIPESVRETSAHDLAGLWTTELTEGIEGTSIRAGFIKLAMSDDGPTALEIRNLKAAVEASQNTGAVIASHTIGGKVAWEEMDVLEEAGLDLHRFIWIHAQTEPDVSILEEAARRGAYVELDSVGAPHQSQSELLETTIALIEAGFADHLLLSHDAGWYNPARPDGLPEDGFRGYTALARDFLPGLLKRGITEEQVRLITVNNPANAFAF
ncbi:MAG TPA: esterase [Anaerolineales bacterium]|nr:esterase [Anaerolineales bacterium]